MKFAIPVLILLTAVLGCAGLKPAKSFTSETAIVNEDVRIPPGEWRSWPFTVETDARINGSFSTEEGVDNEIVFYVTDPENKESIEKNETGRYEFRSIDFRTRRHFNTVLHNIKPGQYHLLFHNESAEKARTVKIRMYLEN